jgi:Ran GTPase-activating protein (RanGAP) involved in mRNA processing and transport
MLELSHCDLGNTPEMLSVILQSDVEIIYLDNNNIDSLGAVTIAEYLESDPPIQRIDLDNNRLNDDDAILISQALKRNTNLCEICLYSNNITSIGVKALLTCVFDSSSLNAISESNHTLVGMNIFSKINNKKLQRCIDRLLELDQLKFQKIVLTLQDKDSLLKYLANVPVELIPEVLAFPHGRVEDQYQYEHLNIVYSTMHMPMLYSYSYNCCADVKRKRDD